MTAKPTNTETLPQGYDAQKGAKELGRRHSTGTVDTSGAVQVEPAKQEKTDPEKPISSSV